MTARVSLPEPPLSHSSSDQGPSYHDKQCQQATGRRPTMCGRTSPKAGQHDEEGGDGQQPPSPNHALRERPERCCPQCEPNQRKQRVMHPAPPSRGDPTQPDAGAQRRCARIDAQQHSQERHTQRIVNAQGDRPIINTATKALPRGRASLCAPVVAEQGKRLTVHQDQRCRSTFSAQVVWSALWARA